MGHDHHEHDHHHHHHSPAAARPSPSAAEHCSHAPTQVSFVIITCSDTRTSASDASGQLIRELLGKSGHTVAGEHLVSVDAQAIRGALELAEKQGARAVVI